MGTYRISLLIYHSILISWLSPHYSLSPSLAASLTVSTRRNSSARSLLHWPFLLLAKILELWGHITENQGWLHFTSLHFSEKAVFILTPEEWIMCSTVKAKGTFQVRRRNVCSGPGTGGSMMHSATYMKPSGLAFRTWAEDKMAKEKDKLCACFSFPGDCKASPWDWLELGLGMRIG